MNEATERDKKYWYSDVDQIQELTIYKCGPFESYWTGASALIDDIGGEEKTRGQVWDYPLKSGWKVNGYIHEDNMGIGLSDFTATHEDFPDAVVFGDYADSRHTDKLGVFCINREALIKFVNDHPPYQTD